MVLQRMKIIFPRFIFEKFSFHFRNNYIYNSNIFFHIGHLELKMKILNLNYVFAGIISTLESLLAFVKCNLMKYF